MQTLSVSKIWPASSSTYKVTEFFCYSLLVRLLRSRSIHYTHYNFWCSLHDLLGNIAEAGVDIIDTAMSPFALGTSQPATEVMVETFKGTPYDTGFDQQLLAEIADYFRPMRDEALESGLLNPKNLICKHQDSSVSGTRWYVIQPYFPAERAACRR